jgi:hypothetical protein
MRDMLQENVTFRLSAELVAQVDELAADEKRTRSQMIRVLLEEALEARLRDADPSPRLGWHGPGDHSLHPVSEIPPDVSGVDA